MGEEVLGVRLFSDASSLVADPFLRRAFVLAENGRGTTSPNPVVGCVVVAGGEIAGEGWHERAGGPHAEVNALRAAGERARGATAYVTLEPCNHTGRTGPCTLALREAGVARVVVGMPDPNPAVEGGGAAALRTDGLDVVFAEDPSPFEEQNEGWLKYARTGTPWVCVKAGATLDGRVSLRAGFRSRITGAGGAGVTGRLRAAADGVMIGAATAVVDDPALTVRDGREVLAGRQPLRVVLAGSTALPGSLGVFDPAGETIPAVVLAGEGAAVDVPHGVECIRYPESEGVRGALRALAQERGVTRVLVEPGPRLFASLWDEDAIDELVVVTAGGVGGSEAVPLFGGAVAGQDPTRLRQRMYAVEAGIAGEDAVTVWRPRRESTKDSERE